MKTDADLIASVLLEDNREAFGELVRRHQGSVRGLLRKATRGDEALAEDLTQEAFLRAFAALATYRGGAQFASWVCRIALNLLISVARQKRPEAPMVAVADSPADAIIFLHDLEGAVAQLRSEERTAFLLTARDELTHEEAAKRLAWPLGTLKTHVNRGKQKLRALLLAPALGGEMSR
jgi:RNA polymerase sigma factor (sigma-70 family)